MPFISFSCPFALARTSNTVLKKVVRVGILVLFLILQEKCSVMHTLAMVMSFMASIMLRHIMASLLLRHIHKWMLNFLKFFFCIKGYLLQYSGLENSRPHCTVLRVTKSWTRLSNLYLLAIEIIIWFLSFILLMWYITLIDLQMWNHTGLPGINLTWL